MPTSWKHLPVFVCFNELFQPRIPARNRLKKRRISGPMHKKSGGEFEKKVNYI